MAAAAAFFPAGFFAAGFFAATVFFFGDAFLAGADFFGLAGDFTFLTALGLAAVAFLALGATFFGDADLAAALGFFAFAGDFLAAAVAFGFFSGKVKMRDQLWAPLVVKALNSPAVLAFLTGFLAAAVGAAAVLSARRNRLGFGVAPVAPGFFS